MLIKIFVTNHKGMATSYSSGTVPSIGDQILFPNGKLVVEKRVFIFNEDVVNILCSPIGNASFTVNNGSNPMSDEEFEKLINKLWK